MLSFNPNSSTGRHDRKNVFPFRAGPFPYSLHVVRGSPGKLIPHPGFHSFSTRWLATSFWGGWEEGSHHLQEVSKRISRPPFAPMLL